jgi:hypothetical protein
MCTEAFPLQWIVKYYSHSNERHVLVETGKKKEEEEAYHCREVFISCQREASLSQQNREYRYCRSAEEIYWKVLQIVEAQSKNKTEEKRLATDLLTEFIQGTSRS